MTEFHKTSDFFTAFRKDYGFPNFYRERPLDWFSDVGMWGVGIGYITAVLTVTIIIAFLGTRGYSRWRVTLQMIISLAIGFSIIVCVSGVRWRAIDYESVDDITGELFEYKLHIGLNQANISLARMNTSTNEYVEYHNLKIGWVEVNQAEMEYREALMRGWPLGILRIARYISVDMGEMRYMRAFRWSGYAAWILLWAAFASWLLSNVLMGSNISYSAALLLITGILKLLACIVYAQQQPDDFFIPMDDGKETKLLLRYDWMYWLTLFMGIFVILMAAIILILDYLRPADMNKFFGTISEFHSPFEEAELAQNQNKDIKGMIRSLSTKRVKRHMNIDSERNRRTTQNRFGTTGTVDSNYVKSMSSIHEGGDDSVDKMNGHARNIPNIQLEMVDINRENEDQPNNNGAEGKDDDLDSEIECEQHRDSIYSTEESMSALGGAITEARSRSTSLVSGTLSHQHLISAEQD